MKKYLVALFGSMMLALAGVAVANPVVDVWTCSLKEGKTAEESQAAGKRWVAVVRRIAGNDEISSSWVSAVVGDIEQFMWVDWYPSLEVWAAARVAMEESEEYEAVAAALEATESCSGNRLYSTVVVD